MREKCKYEQWYDKSASDRNIWQGKRVFREYARVEKMLRKPSESSNDQFSQVDRDGVQEHLISSVIFRRVRRPHGDIWELEKIWDSVNVSHLDGIWRAKNFEYLVNYHNNIKTAMVENVNAVLRRAITDWSREDGNVITIQIVWSGNFMESKRLVELFDQSNNTAPSIQLRIDEFSLHLKLRGQFISGHQINPTAASRRVIIQKSLLDKSVDDGILCAILGFRARQLPYKHLFHSSCITTWFFERFQFWYLDLITLNKKRFHP